MYQRSLTRLVQSRRFILFREHIEEGFVILNLALFANIVKLKFWDLGGGNRTDRIRVASPPQAGKLTFKVSERVGQKGPVRARR